MPKSSNTYYDRLGLKQGASIAAVKRAYRTLALQCHPDKAPHHKQAQAAEKFREIQEAYEILTNDKKRAEYNDKQTRNTCTRSRRSSRPSSSLKPEDFLTEEEWDVFIKLARKILFVINPLKEHIDILATPPDLFELGDNIEERDTPFNLTINEREAFVNFILLFERHFMPNDPSSSAIGISGFHGLQPKEDHSRFSGRGIHMRLRYQSNVVKMIASLANEQDAQIDKLLDEYKKALNYVLYFEKVIGKSYPALELFIKINKEGTLLFSFKEKYGEKDGKNQLIALKKWIKENYSSIEEKTGLLEKSENTTEDSLAIITEKKSEKETKGDTSVDDIKEAEFLIPCTEIISKVTESEEQIIQKTVTEENKKRIILDSIDRLKDYIENNEYEKIQEEIKKLNTYDIDFSKIEEITADQKRASPLMHAIEKSASLNIIELLIEHKSNLDYHLTDSGRPGRQTNLFLEAARSSPPDVVAYLYDLLQPDLNSDQNSKEGSILRVAIKSIPSLFCEARTKRIEVVCFLLDNGARLSPNDSPFRDNHHQIIADAIRNPLLLQDKESRKKQLLLEDKSNNISMAQVTPIIEEEITRLRGKILSWMFTLGGSTRKANEIEAALERAQEHFKNNEKASIDEILDFKKFVSQEKRSAFKIGLPSLREALNKPRFSPGDSPLWGETTAYDNVEKKIKGPRSK